MASSKTRKNRKGAHVLNVRSNGAVKSFEKLLTKGPLTLVYVNAKWCGACHRFNDEVWGPLTKLKNKSVNLASVDSEYVGNTNLPPPKAYPTLMLVGKDGKPATFEDEEGQATNAMPRNSTLSEDREALSNLVMNPTMKSQNKRMNSMPRANVTVKSLAKSPFQALNNQTVNVLPVNKNIGSKKMGNTPSTQPGNSKQILSSNPPDIGADLVSSQTKSPSPTAAMVPEQQKGGALLREIKKKTASLKALLHMRKHSTRKQR